MNDNNIKSLFDYFVRFAKVTDDLNEKLHNIFLKHYFPNGNKLNEFFEDKQEEVFKTGRGINYRIL